MIDASIYSQIKQPEPDNQLARYGQMLQIQNAQLAGQQGQQAFQTQQEERARQNKLRDLLAGGADPYKAALQVGDLKNAGELAKAQSAVEKDKRESAKLDLEMVQKRMETAGNAFNFVRQNPTIENAHAVLDYLGNNKIFTPEQVVQYKQGLTPENVAQQAEMAVRSVLSAKDQLGKVQQSNLGGTTQTAMVDPLTGQQRILSDVKHTQSPDNAATVAATLRGQNMVDARARETLAQGKWQYDAERGGLVNMQTGEFKPATQGGMPLGEKEKPLTDSQSKAALFGVRMQESDKILNELAGQGKTTSIPGARTGFGVGAAVNMASPANAQKLEQAKRDFINATLRRESGAVISPSEFDNAEKQYFPQIGDSPAVIEQKARNRALATKGVMLEVPKAYQEKVKGLGGEPAKPEAKTGKTITRTGTLNGRKVVQYSDGTTEYAD